jgi:Na+-driven multidrug efflux pump
MDDARTHAYQICWVILVYLSFFIVLLFCFKQATIRTLFLLPSSGNVHKHESVICWVHSMEPISVPFRNACIYPKGKETTEKVTISCLMCAYVYFLTTKYCLEVSSCIYFWKQSIWECDSLHHPAHLSSLQHTVVTFVYLRLILR